MRSLTHFLPCPRATYLHDTQGFGLITGGIGEVFVSLRKERLVAPRLSFADVALRVRGTQLQDTIRILV